MIPGNILAQVAGEVGTHIFDACFDPPASPGTTNAFFVNPTAKTVGRRD